MTRVVVLLVVTALWIATRSEPAIWGLAPLLLAIAIILLTVGDRRAAG